MTSVEDELKGRLPQWKMTADQASQAGTELGPACFTQLPQLRGDITEQKLKLCCFTTMSKLGQLI